MASTNSMFSCRVCTGTENPWSFLQNLLGMPGGKAPDTTDKPKQKKKASRRHGTAKPRDPAEIKALVSQWMHYAHPRSREFFANEEALVEVLTQLAQGINTPDDPVLGSDNKCCYWYGEVTKEDQQAAIKMIKPGESVESITYVNRVLAFIFATEESFEQLMLLPKEPFKMSCGDQLCVNLAHISLCVDRED